MDEVPAVFHSKTEARIDAARRGVEAGRIEWDEDAQGFVVRDVTQETPATERLTDG